MDLSKISNVVVGGIDFSDYPDFSDSFIESAYFDGKPMSEKELEELNKDGEFVYESVIKSIY